MCYWKYKYTRKYLYNVSLQDHFHIILDLGVSINMPSRLCWSILVFGVVPVYFDGPYFIVDNRKSETLLNFKLF